MPDEHLRSIVYTSHVVRPMDETDLESLLIEARDPNRECG